MRAPATIIALGLAACMGCQGRPKSDATSSDEVASPVDPHVAEIDLRQGAPEQSQAALFGGDDKSHVHLVRRLSELESGDNAAKGVFVRLGSADSSMARAEEIGRRLAALREKKLPVVCHADGYSNASAMLAARGCDEIWLSPAGHVDTVGLAAQLVFGRSLLDKLDVQVDFLQVGKYKGAQEPFTRDSASPEARESLQTALAGLRRAWIDVTETGRNSSGQKLGLEVGPHTPEAAKALGLIDAVGFESEARARAVELSGVKGKLNYFGGRDTSDDGIGELVRLLSGGGHNPLPHVAVVRASGAISMGGGSLFASDGISQRSLTTIIEKLDKDSATRAVVLRIDSPGGSALASDLLWRSLMDLRASKPLVVSVGGMAASGGYYMACAGTKVVAERTSIIGSIGVVAGKLSFEKSLAELGIHVESVPADPNGGTRALYGSALSPWDDATREKVLASMQSIYDLFLARIAEGRQVDVAKIKPAAAGRIMGGDDALAAGLIDELGGFDRALVLARELAGDAELPVVVMGGGSGLLDLLGIADPEARARALEQLEHATAKRTARWLSAGLMPFRSELEAFAASAGPLLEGERVLAALPFALIVR